MKRNLRSQKPHLLKLEPSNQDSFIVKGDAIAWNNPWHFHPEVEILYCIRGKGVNYVGNYIGEIEEGEVLLFGKNLPHTRQRNKSYYTTHEEEPETIVIQFNEDFLGDRIFLLYESHHIKRMLQNAQRGIKFNGNSRRKIIVHLQQLKHRQGFNAVLGLLALLDEMARADDFEYLNHLKYSTSLSEKDTLRINHVYAFVHNHFREDIRLETIAKLANMNSAAFCRYFKARTRKSFVQYLNETRVAYACELLMEGEQDVTEICYASGFNNLSNFNKQFKKVMRTTPSMYKSRSLKKVHQPQN